MAQNYDPGYFCCPCCRKKRAGSVVQCAGISSALYLKGWSQLMSCFYGNKRQIKDLLAFQNCLKPSLVLIPHPIPIKLAQEHRHRLGEQTLQGLSCCPHIHPHLAVLRYMVFPGEPAAGRRTQK